MESMTFGSEFMALNIFKNMIVDLSYKLQMFGLRCDGTENVFCDKRGVVRTASVAEYTPTRKHNSIDYHAVCEAVSAVLLISRK